MAVPAVTGVETAAAAEGQGRPQARAGCATAQGPQKFRAPNFSRVLYIY
jgi:hypothetical protein